MLAPIIRLAIVGVRWPPETFIRRKLDGLAAAGLDVTVFTSSRAPSRTANGIRLVYTPRLYGWRALLRETLRALSAAITSPPYARQAARIALSRGKGPRGKFALILAMAPFANKHADVLHFEWNSAAIAYEPLFDFLDAAVVVSCRGSQVQIRPHDPEQSQLVEGLRTTFAKADAVHCVSNAIQQDAMHYGLDPAKAHVIRPAVDPHVFAPGPERGASEVYRVVTTGSLIWRKGLEYALQAIRLLKERNIPVRYDIIGDGPESQRILFTIADLGLTDEVRLLGALSPAEVGDTLRQADTFLLSSLSEGISNAVLEAMACGLAVVTTDCGGMREAVTDGVEGFVVPVRDPVSMADALETLAHDPTLRRGMGNAGRQRILSAFTLDRQIAQFTDLYSAVAANR
jgi:colanic acid/amylovoran biosynthesis glycosyltransferase